jgi:hypothetical protein
LLRQDRIADQNQRLQITLQLSLVVGRTDEAMQLVKCRQFGIGGTIDSTTD